MNVLSSKMDTRPRRMRRGGSPGLLAGSSVASLLESTEEDGGRGMFPDVFALGISPFTLEQSLFMQCPWWGWWCHSLGENIIIYGATCRSKSMCSITFLHLEKSKPHIFKILQFLWLSTKKNLGLRKSALEISILRIFGHCQLICNPVV